MVRVPHSLALRVRSSPASCIVAVPGGRCEFAAATLALAVAGFARGRSGLCAGAGCGRCTITIGPFSFPNPFAGPRARRADRAERHRVGADRRRRLAASRVVGSRRSADRRASQGQAAAGRPEPAFHLRLRANLRRQLFPVALLGRERRDPGGDLPGAVPERRDGALHDAVRRNDRPGRVADRRALHRQPNALKFQQSYEESCSCRRPGRAGRTRSRRRRRDSATGRTKSS